MAVRQNTSPAPDALVTIVDGVELPFDTPPLDWSASRILEENYPYEVPEGFTVGSGVSQIINLDNIPHRFEVRSRSDDLLVFLYDNPTAIKLDNANKHVGACMAPGLSTNINFTIDDNGLFPADGIYSGTLSPPVLNADIYFKIEKYTLDGIFAGVIATNSRDEGIYLSEDGSHWYANLNNPNGWMPRPDASSFQDDAKYVIAINGNRAQREYIVDSSLNCEPTILEIPALTIPEVGKKYTYSYRVNGGNVITLEETAGGAPSQTVFTNILAYYGFFSDLVTSDTGPRAFRAKYGEPVKGGSRTDPNFIQAQSNTIEFLLTEGAEHDLIKTIFGQAVTIHSCAIVDWK
ncbi:hypothetical protein [Acinetobacter vivianii]|nr:hypothetical protein [Acinetobacter vivianii]GGI59361.1 hypothetical protein GCM10011446_08560 [Acinetobacter vivianii]